ncbi:MAG: DUF2294 domain-containing protein [Anaerolineae bacterium]|nr:DUF2294 domain-containing protein [Anaerolineae bacterium]
MPGKTRGQAEAEITKAIIKLEKEYMGRGPVETRTFFLNDMIVVRLRGILTQAELKLAESPEGQILVKETRRQLFESSRSLLEDIVSDIVGCGIISLHTDMSTRTGERIIVLTVDTNLDNLFD